MTNKKKKKNLSGLLKASAIFFGVHWIKQIEKMTNFMHIFTRVFSKGSDVCRNILREPTVAPNMWYQNEKQYPFSPAGGSSEDFSWAESPFMLGEELSM